MKRNVVVRLYLGSPTGLGNFTVLQPRKWRRKGYAVELFLTYWRGGVIAAFAGPNLARWSKQLLPDEFAGSYASLIANLWLRRKPHSVDPETKVPV